MEINFLKVLLVYLLIINIITMAVYVYDKMQAKKGGQRISEISLLLITFLGGSIGAIIAMKLTRHKIKNFYFKYGVPIMAVLHFGLVMYTWGGR